MPNPYVSGAQILAEDGNQSLPITLTAGETIDGATLPVPVYMDIADEEVKACDADDLDALEFIGFAVSNSTDGNDITVQTKGLVNGFTGLTIGSKYYVQNDKTIDTIEGNNSIFIGKALSTTQILILKRPDYKITYAASNVLHHSADAIASGAHSITYVKVKEIQIFFGGEIRVGYTYKTNINGEEMKFKVYINGVAVGTEQSDYIEDWTTFTEDFDVESGDLIQVYTRQASITGGSAQVKEFRIYYDKDVLPDPESGQATVNLD